MISLKKFVYSVLGVFLLWIPISLIPAGLISFVANVIFNSKFAFMVIWRWTFLIVFCLDLLLLIINLGRRYFTFLSTARRLHRPYSVIERAVMEYKFHYRKPIKEWTAEWLDDNLKMHAAKKELAEVLENFIRGS